MAAPDAPFAFPKAHDFPPMYTLQPNTTTRAAQLDRWSDMVRSYCAHHRVFRLATGAAQPDAPPPAQGTAHADAVFRNARLDRHLKPEAVRAVMAHMVSQSRAEPVGGGGPDTDVFFVWWRSPDDWAEAIRAWVERTGQTGAVLTLYEISDGEAARGSGLEGIDAAVLRRALAVLERQRKAQMISTGGVEMGVKFFSS